MSDSPFSPAPGIQLQIKLFGIVNDEYVKFFLKNAGSSDVSVESWTVQAVGEYSVKDQKFYGRRYTELENFETEEAFVLEPNGLSEPLKLILPSDRATIGKMKKSIIVGI